MDLSFLKDILIAFLKSLARGKADHDAAEAAQEEKNVETEAHTKAKIEAAHKEVDTAPDPRAALREQLRRDGLLR